MLEILVFGTWLFISLTLYVYLGYPVILAILSRVLKRKTQQADITPPVSLVVAAYNEELVIGQKLDNSLELDYPRDKLQIIIVADGSNDGTAEIARRYADKGVVVLDSPERRGKSAALNRGVGFCTGEILVFSDANAFYYPDAIKKLVRNYNDPTVGCVSGKKTVTKGDSKIAESEGLYWKYESFLKKGETKTGSTVGVVGEMNSLRKALYQPIPENVINDDAFLALRVLENGSRVLYEPDAVSWETASLSTKDEITRRQRINAGRYQQMFMVNLWRKIPPFELFKLFSHKFFRLLLPFFMIGALVFNALVMLFPDRPILLVVTFIGQILAYVLAIIGYWAEQNGRKIKLAAAAYYIVSSNVASFNGFLRFIRGRQTVLWDKAQRGTSG